MRRDIGKHGLRFEGDRFDGGRLPVSMLPDLIAYEAMTIGFLKEIWEEEHPDDPILPKGMSEAVSFSLVSVSDGSAKAMTVASFDEDDQMSLDEVKVGRLGLVERSADRTVNFWKRSAEGDLREFLPSKVYTAVVRFRTSLAKNKDEKIVLYSPANDDHDVDRSENDLVTIDYDLCDRILQHAKPVTNVRMGGIGVINGIRAGKHETKLTIKKVGDGKEDKGTFYVKVPKDRFHSELKEYVDSGYVFFDMLVIPKEGGSPTVEREIALAGVPPEDWQGFERCVLIVDSFGLYGDDWDEEGASAITEAARKTAKNILRRRPLMHSMLVPLPRRDGGISFEFNLSDRWSWALRVLRDGSLKLFGVHLDSEQATVHLRFESRQISELVDVLDDVVTNNLRHFQSDVSAMKKDWSLPK